MHQLPSKRLWTILGPAIATIHHLSCARVTVLWLYQDGRYHQAGGLGRSGITNPTKSQSGTITDPDILFPRHQTVIDLATPTQTRLFLKAGAKAGRLLAIRLDHRGEHLGLVTLTDAKTAIEPEVMARWVGQTMAMVGMAEEQEGLQRRVEIAETALNNPVADGIILLDKNRRVIQANRTAVRLLGQRKKLDGLDLVTDCFGALPASPGQASPAELVESLLASATRTDQPQHQQISVGRSAHQRWLLCQARSVEADGPGQPAMTLTIRDTTKERVQELQLNQQLAEIADQNRQWQAIFNGVQESIVLLDTLGRVLSANPATERITGRKSSEAIGHHIGQLFPKVEGAIAGVDKQGRSGLYQTLEDQRPSDLFEAIVETKDGRHIWINYTYTPLRDPQGEITAMVRVTSDVSTVKVVEQMKNDFVSIASHELRTPLGVINSYLNLFLNGQLGHLTDDQRVFMQRIYHSSGDMSALVEDLLNMSRIEDGRIEIAAQPCNLLDLVNEAVGHLEPRYQAKRITVTVDPVDGQPIIQADKQKLEQALTNLIDNAIKYTYEDGQIRISIRQKPEAVAISVKDSGVGIKPENLEHIFEKFYREGNSLSVKEGGSGLGLYISRKLVELHGGTITVASKHDNGSTFTVNLPLHQIPSQAH